VTRAQAIEWVNAQVEGLAQEDDWQDDINDAWLAIMGRPRDHDEQDDGAAYSLLCAKIGAVS
jgi:hypothetical protein